jgi:dolichyl-phosphate beta-glucosyltransferase
MQIFLSLVIPAYNEEGPIAQTLAKVRDYLAQQEYSSEIIVVNDGSTDRTLDKAAEALTGIERTQILSRHRNFGKGFSVKEGALAAKGQHILFSDADLSTPIEELDRFLPWLEEGFDVIIGSRALPDSDIQVRQSFLRESMGKMFNVFVQLLVVKGIKDTQCGFKLFRREAAKDIFPKLKTRGFSFDVEVLLLSRQSGYRIKEIPVIWRNSPQSKVKVFSSSLRMFVDLWKIRFSR